MLRWTIADVFAVAAIGTIAGPDEALARHGVVRAAGGLPALQFQNDDFVSRALRAPPV